MPSGWFAWLAVIVVVLGVVIPWGRKIPLIRTAAERLDTAVRDVWSKRPRRRKWRTREAAEAEFVRRTLEPYGGLIQYDDEAELHEAMGWRQPAEVVELMPESDAASQSRRSTKSKCPWRKKAMAKRGYFVKRPSFPNVP